ncbi:uncharacterized protein LOC132699912 [Cylas formicarius]|uniref:uncharacterized protein LOC132699912 n=1 Tax=Cylas formicarius TaxID=197179 RepID=UPI00295899AC|nr:uncharacterized protein LOC132699912 [Cylas formicarius]
MVLNVMIQLCKITRASKLFQRNFYLPLLKPLSPKDALRRHIITGKDVLSKRLEHWIPVFEEYAARVLRRKYTPKGKGKKRQRKKDSMKYVTPFFDDEMDYHTKLQHTVNSKPKGRGQCYTYFIPEKRCTLVLTHQMERCVREKAIVDILISLRHEKILVKMKDGTKIVMPLVAYDGRAPLYRGEGWTRKELEEFHHHGRETTFPISQLFEAKESGVEEWELEMMRMANKRKKKMKGEGTEDWKAMLAATAESMDWDAFEEETKQIVEEANDPVDDEPITMALENIDKTVNVNEKLKDAGDEVMSMLPIIPEIPELIKVLKDQSDLTDIANVSGVIVSLSDEKQRFVPGQMVTSEDGDLFVPGQTTVMESGEKEYTPGFTVLLDNEPTLIPGLVMGDDPNKAMFLPGESTITESGELQFTETEDDVVRRSPTPPFEKEVEEVELDEVQNSEDEEIEMKPPPKREKKEFIYERPKREYATENMGPKHRERAPKKIQTSASLQVTDDTEAKRPIMTVNAVIYDLQVPTFEKDLLEQEKERVQALVEKTGKEEAKVEKKRREIKQRAKQLIENRPKAPKYEPLEPVRKSEKLREFEQSIKKGKFFDNDYKKYLTKERNERFNWLEDYQYRNTFDTVGILRHRIWKSVYSEHKTEASSKMPINVKISLCKITRASKLFQRNYYLPLLKPLSPKDALRRKVITGQNILGARIEHYIPVLKPHDEKLAEKKRRGKGVPVIKKKLKLHDDVKYVEPFLDDDMENHDRVQRILAQKPRGRGQYYVYEVTDKNCNLVINYQMEKALKDKDIVDITMAQRSEKILVKLSNGMKVAIPVAPFTNDRVTLYRGSGWTKEVVEQEHHHGKETMSIAKLFEAKESGVEEWELEMMRMANKRKKKIKGEDSADWKTMMAGCLESMDWDQFEEETKQIVEEKEEIVEEENIPMEMDDMEKTKHVNEKLIAGGEEVLNQLPTLIEIPDVIKNLESGEMEDLVNVSGARVSIPQGRACFVPGQMVKSEDNEVFMPGQTVETENGTPEYIPGITVLMDGEPTLIPGLVMGEEEQPAMFLPGESTITQEGQLKFEATEEDLPPPPPRPRRSLTPSPPPSYQRKPREIKDEEIVIKRRNFDEPSEPLIKEKVKRRAPVIMKVKEVTPPRESFRPQRQPLEDPLRLLEEERRLRDEQERKRMKERMEEKVLKEESKVNKLRIDIRKKCKEFKIEKPPKYEPIQPVKKSQKLEELELSIKKGTFFDDDKTKQILEKAKSATRMLKYQAALDAYGNNFRRFLNTSLFEFIHRSCLLKKVKKKMVNYVLSFCKITGASKIFTRNFYLPLLKPLTPRDALRTLRITGKWLLGAKIQHYIPVLLNHRQERSKRSKNYGKREHKRMEDFTYMTPCIDPENETQKVLSNILQSKSGTDVFVYTVEDKKYNIVFEAAFELALRDGDIVDILVSQKNDKILVKMKDFKKVPLEIQYYEQNGGPLFCGEAATTEEEEQNHHHGKYTMSLAKLFEDKEMQEEKWEEELKRIMKKKKRHKWEGTKAFKEMMKQIMKKFDWKKFEEDAKKVIDEIEVPATENPIAMEIADLQSTKNVNEVIARSEDLLGQLPTLKDIPEILKNLGDATLTEIESDRSINGRVTGAKVKLTSGKECFISGQMVHTEDGDVFVPGQTVENEFGDEYAPGITINIDNKPTLINGLIMGDNEKDPLFLPTQSTITSGGQLTFASEVEERPPPEPEEQRQKRRRKLLRIISVVPEEENNDQDAIKECIEEVMKEQGVEDMNNIEIIVGSAEKSSIPSDEETDEVSTDSTLDSAELNTSEMEEVDLEAIRLKHEQQRLELEKLKQMLQDDGMNDLLNSLEEKKKQLQRKLDELRKISLVSQNNLISYVSDSDALNAASRITQENDTLNKLSEILIAITRRSAAFRDKNSVRVENINMDVNIKQTDIDVKFNKCSSKLKVLFKNALVVANDVYKNRPKDQLLALHSVVDIISDMLKNNPEVLNELLSLMQTSSDRLEVCDAVLRQLTYDISHTKMAALKNLAAEDLSIMDAVKYLDRIIGDGHIMNCSFTKLVKVSPGILQDFSQFIKASIKTVDSEEKSVEALQDCIVNSVKTMMSNNLEELLEKKESTLREFIQEALSFAKALDLDDIVENLSQRKTSLNNLKDISLDMIKRMTIIRQLAERDYSLKTAISRIKKNPECAKSDPRIRQLIRESAVLISDEKPVRNSREIPYDLMKKQNLLAIEDFILKRMRLDCPVLVTRGSLQAVVPKDASRGVLAGRIPFVLIDESGVTNFKPMHMLSSISVNKNRERRIGDYLSGVRERSKSISVEKDEAKNYLQAKSNAPDGQYMGTARGRAMSSGALFGGYAGPRF